MSSLHISKFGEGADLILLHGWGSSSKVWQTNLDELSQNFRVWCIDLPGHGESHAVNWDNSVEQGIEILANQLPNFCSIVGWSLGGVVAQLYAKHYPERVENLMLIASTPKFTASTEWKYGMKQEAFENFFQQFSKSPHTALQQFCSLQVVNSNAARNTLSILLNALSNQSKHINNILWGLKWLRDIDLSQEQTLKELPIKMLHGDKDVVCSIQAAEDMQVQWKNTTLIKIPDAGHAPFISHSNEFLEQLKASCSIHHE